jgi:hypothetical protein
MPRIANLSVIEEKALPDRYGRVYKLYDHTDPSQFYIGSTAQTLLDRLKAHKQAARGNLKNTTLYEYMRQKNLDNFRIELLKNVVYKRPYQLREDEEEALQEYKPTLNMRLAACGGNNLEEYRRQWAIMNADRYCCEHCDFKTAYITSFKRHNAHNHTQNTTA